MTQGSFGAQECESSVEHEGRWGRYTAVCPIDVRDDGAIIEVFVSEQRHEASDLVARAWISPSGGTPREFVSQAIDALPQAISTGDLGAGILALINHVRERELRLPPLEIVTPQASTLARAHRHYLIARRFGDLTRMKAMYLGALSGRGIAKPIIDGGVCDFFIPSTTSPERFLEQVLSSPFARYQLFTPHRDSAAVHVEGELTDNPNVMVATWQTSKNYIIRSDDPERLVSFVSRLRGERDLPLTRTTSGRYGPLFHALARESFAAHVARETVVLALEPPDTDVGCARIAGRHPRPTPGPGRGVPSVFGQLVYFGEIEPEPSLCATLHLSVVVGRTGWSPVIAELLKPDELYLAVHHEVIEDPNSNWMVPFWVVMHVYRSELSNKAALALRG